MVITTNTILVVMKVPQKQKRDKYHDVNGNTIIGSQNDGGDHDDIKQRLDADSGESESEKQAD